MAASAQGCPLWTVSGSLTQYREALGGVEPIWRTLRDAGVQIAPSTYYEVKSRAPAARAVRDGELIP